MSDPLVSIVIVSWNGRHHLDVCLAAVAAQGLSALLLDVSPFDPLTYGLVAMVLTGVCALASFIPARRATRVDPIVALRAE